jgi:AMP deaminase
LTSSALSPTAEKAAASEPLEVPTYADGLSPVASNARRKPACEEKHRNPDDISRSNDVPSIIKNRARAFRSHTIGAFDSVDDESNPEQPVDRTSAANWSRPEQPNYSWQLYMLYGNLVTLNALRRAKGLNTIALRPHCGESGDPSHLAGAYLCAASINHGIRLSDSAVLQYLYYLDQVGLSISPISNHFLFLKARKSPFPQFFKRGLNVTLSTDDPMLFHLSEDPLLEEYTTARTAYDLSMLDMCEIARNSVLQSGFEDARKRAWLGDRFEEGLLGCAPSKCNVTPSRATFRGQLLQAERALLQL